MSLFSQSNLKPRDSMSLVGGSERLNPLAPNIPVKEDSGKLDHGHPPNVLSSKDSITEKKNSPDLYPMRLNCTRMMNIEEKNGGWKIELNGKAKELFKEFVAKRNIEADRKLTDTEVSELSLLLVGNRTFAAMLGKFDAGKSYLLNLLLKSKYPSGQTEDTLGMNFVPVQPGEDLGNFCFIDTEGSDKPLSQEMIDSEEKILKDTYPAYKNINPLDPKDKPLIKQLRDESRNAAIGNKVMIDKFIRDMTFLVADVVIILVNAVTTPDQSFITGITQNLEDYNQSATLPYKKHGTVMIVHNFKSVSKIEEVETMKKRYIEACFSGDTNRVIINDKQVEYWVGDNNKTAHIFLGREGDMAGGSNGVYIQCLKNLLNAAFLAGERPCHLLKLTESMKKVLKQYFKDVNTPEFVVKKKDNDFELRIVHSQPLERISDSVYVNDDFLYNFREIKCKFDMDIIENSNDNTLVIKIDAPGMKFVKMKKLYRRRKNMEKVVTLRLPSDYTMDEVAKHFYPILQLAESGSSSKYDCKDKEVYEGLRDNEFSILFNSDYRAFMFGRRSLLLIDVKDDEDECDNDDFVDYKDKTHGEACEEFIYGTETPNGTILSNRDYHYHYSNRKYGMFANLDRRRVEILANYSLDEYVYCNYDGVHQITLFKN